MSNISTNIGVTSTLDYSYINFIRTAWLLIYIQNKPETDITYTVHSITIYISLHPSFSK